MRSEQRDAAERALYELAVGRRRTDLLVLEAKRAARAGRLEWERGPEQWMRWRERGRSVVVNVDDGAAHLGVLMSTRPQQM